MGSARTRATEKYKANNARRYNITFYKKRDAEIIEHLNAMENKTDYIRNLIINDIMKKQ